MERKIGILMPAFSLPGEYSCGDLGREARNFIDLLKRGGFSYWQMLPLLVTDDFNSPYSSPSAFAGNPYFISLETLFEKGLITKSELQSEKEESAFLCNYERLKKTRLAVLKKASKRITNKGKILDFCEQNPHINDFCRFYGEDVFLWQFIQYEFFDELSSLKKYANENGVKLIGDLPFYVSKNGADVFYNPEYFSDTLQAGVPPDYFNEEGQLWGNPVYNFEAMEQDNFLWHRQRLSFWLRFFDGIRLDHFRAIDSFYAVKRGEETAKNGKWIEGPKMSLINALKSVQNDHLIIAEDLGEITNSVRNLVRESGFMCTRVLQFGFLSCDDTHRPHSYPENCVAYTGTHDNNTLLGYIWEMDPEKRKEFFDYCGYTGNDFSKGQKNALKALLASHASLVIIPLQDLLCFGADTRINTPGTTGENWRYRVTKDQLESLDFENLFKENKLYKRE